MHTSFVTIAVLALLISGCSEPDRPAAASIAREDIEALKSTVTELEQKLWSLELTQNQYSKVWFDPTGENAYQRIDTNIGTLFVVLDNVEAYLDGQKITLLVGNPNNVTFAGFKLKASWSQRMPDFKNTSSTEFRKAWQEYSASEREKELNLTDTLNEAGNME